VYRDVIEALVRFDRRPSMSRPAAVGEDIGTRRSGDALGRIADRRAVPALVARSTNDDRDLGWRSPARWRGLATAGRSNRCSR
jgi:hypothetical protein